MPRRRNPVAPAEPKTKPETKPDTRPAPRPATPAPERRPEPFTPTQPKTIPRPKLADYDRSVHPALRSFWDAIPQEHGFFLHPILFEHGDHLSRGAFKFVFDRLERLGVEAGDVARTAMATLGQMRQLEQGHHEELTQLAREVTESVWGIPSDQLKGGIDDVSGDVEESDLGFEDKSHLDLDAETVQQIDKRILLNTLIQGAAVHMMFGIHHMVGQELRKIDEGLPDVYDLFALAAVGMYWQIDFSGMGDQIVAGAIGYERVEYEQREDENVPVTYAKATCFPVLAQEFSKGVTEIICMHGFEGLDDETQRIVVEKADSLLYEAPQIMVGPELWRRVLAVMPRDAHIADLLMNIAKLPPEPLFEVMTKVVNGDKRAFA